MGCFQPGDTLWDGSLGAGVAVGAVLTSSAEVFGDLLSDENLHFSQPTWGEIKMVLPSVLGQEGKSGRCRWNLVDFPTGSPRAARIAVQELQWQSLIGTKWGLMESLSGTSAPGWGVQQVNHSGACTWKHSPAVLPSIWATHVQRRCWGFGSYLCMGGAGDKSEGFSRQKELIE